MIGFANKLKKTAFKYCELIICGIDASVVFLAFVTSLMVAYFINPLINVDLTEWNRTFSPATLAGISIDKRIVNFYKLFFLYIPLLIIIFIIVYSLLFRFRKAYKDYFKSIIIIGLFPTIAAYISRYAQGSNEINQNLLLLSLITFLVLLIIFALIDKDEKYSFSDITFSFAIYFILFICSNMILAVGDSSTHIILSAIVALICMVLIRFLRRFDNLDRCIHIFASLMLWLPAVIRIALEGMYYLNEKGLTIQRYNTNINITIIFYTIAVAFISWGMHKRNILIKNVGYIGTIASVTAVGYFSYSYQYIWNYGSLANVYELGNPSVAMDSVLEARLPVIDYFSAHALSDVWTQIIYCLIHDDLKGILVNPYGGLVTILSCIILFYIVQELFDGDIALLFVLLFPGMVSGIKWVSLCTISILVLIYIYKKPRFFSFFVYWGAILISAFTTYDEGISLGIATIVAFVLIEIAEKKWLNLKRYIISGASVACCTLLFYVIYASIRGVGVVSRIKEWISVSVGSNSTWATAVFGEQSSFAFLASYFLVPITAITLLAFAFLRFIKTKKNGLLTLLTITFSFGEILYITRGIVFHNLAVCSGRTGVLLNFIHWTVSMYVLLRLSENENKNKALIGWTGALMAVIIFEGIAITTILPDSNSSIMAQAIVSSESWELQDDMTENWGKERIVYDEASTAFVNQFSTVFDTLLEDDETYIDFANITSMYLLTGRERPCYVSQSPSLLTDLYSQEKYLDEVNNYQCPLAILGTTSTSYISQMQEVPHNIRYYKIAEYIFSNYRPLVCFNEFVIWCKKGSYDSYYCQLAELDLNGLGYTLVDYGYDFTALITDGNGNQAWDFKPYHSYNLQDVPYIWANYDGYKAEKCIELSSVCMDSANNFRFSGSQSVVTESGNYLAFECTNSTEEDISINIVFLDSNNDGAKFEYYFTVKPGTNNYLIRASQDYFWYAYNVDTILFGSNEYVVINDVRILEGD